MEYSGSNKRLLSAIEKFQFTSIRQSIKKLYSWYDKNRAYIKKEKLFFDN